MLSLRTDFDDFTTFNPAAHHEQAVDAMLDQVVTWSRALKTLRPDAPVTAADAPQAGQRMGSQ
jgi:hypothetical protein